MLVTSAYSVAERFIGVSELPGEPDNPFIMSMLTLDMSWPEADEVPWCSAFVNYIAWLLSLSRSKDLRARSWLDVGTEVESPRVGMDVVIFSRGNNPKQGHVGFYGGMDGSVIYTLGGNQSNSVCVKPYSLTRLLGYRRLYEV